MPTPPCTPRVPTFIFCTSSSRSRLTSLPLALVRPDVSSVLLNGIDNLVVTRLANNILYFSVGMLIMSSDSVLGFGRTEMTKLHRKLVAAEQEASIRKVSVLAGGGQRQAGPGTSSSLVSLKTRLGSRAAV